MTDRPERPRPSPLDPLLLLAETLDREDSLDAYLGRQRRAYRALAEERERRDEELRGRLRALPFP